MTNMEKLRQLLLSFPGFDGELPADFTLDRPGVSGLFPGGLKEVDRYVDLLGNMQVKYLLLFTLHHRLRPGQDCAQWLMGFQNWLAQKTDEVQIHDIKIPEASQLEGGVCTLTLGVYYRQEVDGKGEQVEDNGTVYH